MKTLKEFININEADSRGVVISGKYDEINKAINFTLQWDGLGDYNKTRTEFTIPSGEIGNTKSLVKRLNKDHPNLKVKITK